MDVVARMGERRLPEEGSSVMMAGAIDIERHEHLLDFEGGSGDTGKLVEALLAELYARGLRAGVSRSWCLLVTGEKRSSRVRIWRPATQSVESRKAKIQSSARFKGSATLNATFLSANHMENVMGVTRETIGKVWRGNTRPDQWRRWMGAGRLRAQGGATGMRAQEDLTAAFGGRVPPPRRFSAPPRLHRPGPALPAFGACR